MRFLFAKAHQNYVRGQAVQPGGESGFAAEGVNFAEELEEGFLGEVFGEGGITAKGSGLAQEAGFVKPAKFTESFGIAAPRLLRNGAVAAQLRATRDPAALYALLTMAPTSHAA